MQVAIWKYLRYFFFPLHLWPPGFYSATWAGHRVSARMPVLGAGAIRCHDGVMLARFCLGTQEITETRIPLSSGGSCSGPSKRGICPYKTNCSSKATNPFFAFPPQLSLIWASRIKRPQLSELLFWAPCHDHEHP